MHPYEIGFVMRTRDIDKTIKLNRGSLYTVAGWLRELLRRPATQDGSAPAGVVEVAAPIRSPGPERGQWLGVAATGRAGLRTAMPASRPPRTHRPPAARAARWKPAVKAAGWA